MTRQTIAKEIDCDGVALHAGSAVRMRLSPGRAGEGVVFRRSDLGNREIPAFYAKVAETRLGTVISDGNVSVGVIEHLMAAVAGLGIDDLEVTLDGPEPPILDGDAQGYVMLFDKAGLKQQAGQRRALKIRKRVTAEAGDAYALFEPAHTLSFDFDIAFKSPAIGAQVFSWTFSTDGFRRDIAPARTFGFMSELEALNKAGLAKGASLDNTLAIDGDRVVNAGRMRFKDEFVRHKILDALGDMALAGAPIIGRFEGHRSGHALNNQLLRAVFADSANYEWLDA
ncbi:MAG TPA: UDP-3-O-acyl-N-acetylglucosamine deacetylase [Rhizomicrobium sp.]|nr:UDP-3-O-acyl-N-acetylglucosamine deacetylase [Rhizomicrobium sp.]